MMHVCVIGDPILTLARFDPNQEGYQEGQRLTRNLINAERAYRDATKRLRELKQEVQTVDSSHFTTISTAPPTITPRYTANMKARHDRRVKTWQQ